MQCCHLNNVRHWQSETSREMASGAAVPGRMCLPATWGRRRASLSGCDSGDGEPTAAMASKRQQRRAGAGKPGVATAMANSGDIASSPAVATASAVPMSSERPTSDGERAMAVARRASEHWQRQAIRLVPKTSSPKLLPVNSSV